MSDEPKKFTVSVDSADGVKVETFEAETAYEAVLEAFRAGLGPVGSFKMTVTEGDAYMIDMSVSGTNGSAFNFSDETLLRMQFSRCAVEGLCKLQQGARLRDIINVNSL